MSISPHKKPVYDQRVPNLSPEVQARTVDNVYAIKTPEIVKSILSIDGEEKAPILQLKCQSLYMRKGDMVYACNSTVKTIIGEGTGDQTEIIECGKCRTSYLIRTSYDKNGELDLNMSVWQTPRNIRNYSFHKHTDDGEYLVEFYTQKTK